MGIAVVVRFIAGKLDQISGYRLYNGLCGVEYVAKKNKVLYKIIHSSNSESFNRM